VVPPDLSQATIRAAVPLVTGKVTVPVVSGAVASLVHRMLWSITMIKISGVVAGVVLIGLAGYGAGLAAQRAGQSPAVRPAGGSPGKPAAPDGPLAGQEPRVQKESGRQEPPGRTQKTLGPEKVFSRLDSQATILKVAPDGTRVKKGDQICELDSAALRDRLVNQRITTKAAEANVLNAKLDREVAEIAVTEYLEGDYAGQQLEIRGEIKIAEAELALAQDELNGARSINTLSGRQLRRLELNELRARSALEKAQHRLKVLLQFTKNRRVKELRTAVERAHSTELAKQATWELEKAKEAKLERQIALCTIIAPIDGTLRYTSLTPIEEGAIVGVRQLLFRILPEDQPR
jgi:hypothetical protein